MASRRPPSLAPLVYLSSLRFFAHVFRGAGVAAVVSDLEGRITHANPAAERLFGWEPGELIGRTVFDLAAPGEHAILLQQVVEAGGVWSGEVEDRRKSGAVFPVRLTVSVVRDDADEPIGLLGIVADDTASARQRSRLASLIALGAALNAESSPEALLGRICRDARELFNVDGVYLGRLDEKTQELVGLAADGPAAGDFRQWRVRLSDEATTVTAVRERRPVIRHDIVGEGTLRQTVEIYKVRALLSAPLVRGDRVLGILSFTDTQRPDRFGPEDAELAQAFAELAAVALDDARLHAAERKKSERLLTLTRVCQLLTASLEQGEVLDAIAEGSLRLFGADDVHIFLLETLEGPLRLACFRSAVGGTPPVELPFGQSYLGEVVRTGRPWQSTDVQREPARFGWAYAERHDLHACLMVPLIANGYPLGGISVFSRQVREFDAEDLELMRAFAHQAALAVHNAQRLVRERIAARVEQVVERARGLAPRDRELVEQLLAAAERIVELGAPPGPRRLRTPSDRGAAE